MTACSVSLIYFNKFVVNSIIIIKEERKIFLIYNRLSSSIDHGLPFLHPLSFRLSSYLLSRM